MEKKLIILIAVIITGIFSCGKVGPAGPEGPPGRDGLDGATSYVYYFNVPLSDFVNESYNNSWNAYGYIDGVTIMLEDLVMVYVNLSSDGNGDNYWQALPYIEYIGTTDVFIQHSFGIMDIDDDSGNDYYQAGDIMFSLITSDGFPPYDDMNSDALLKYNVYILKGQEGKKAKLPKHVDLSKKSEVEKYFKSLKEKV